MIVDLLDQAACYHGIGPRIAAGLVFLRETDLAAMDNGQYEIDGESVYAMVSEYQTKPKEQGQWEAHRRYLDIQCLVAGEEIMGYAPVNGLKVTQAYNVERDCLFLAGEGEFLSVRPGMFLVFMPQDAHMPGLAGGSLRRVKKIVVKVRVTY